MTSTGVWAEDADVKGPHPQTRTALCDVNLEALQGQRVTDARTTIESLGGELRARLPGKPSRGDLRPNRITVIQDGEVITEVIGFG